MEISQKELGDVILLDIEGELTMFNAPTLKKYFENLIIQNKRKILINFENIYGVDSSGLGALIAGHTALKKNKGIMKFYCIPDSVSMLFKLTKVEKLFEIFDTRSDALASFK